MRPFTPALVCSLALLATPVLGGAELLLEDGQLLEGRSVERKDSLFLLELETGGVLPVPVELVKQVRLTGDDDPEPGGLELAEPRTLAGPAGPVEAPRRAEQIEVLGEPSRFRPGVIDPRWEPTSDLDLDPRLNDFNPARWYVPPIDPVWRPRSDYKISTDVTEFNPARWYVAPIDSTWVPTDGFRRSREWRRKR